MALDPKDIPITRKQVAGWLDTYNLVDPATRGDIRDFLMVQITATNILDTEVNTSGHDNLGDVTPVVDMIIADLPSYGFIQ